MLSGRLRAQGNWSIEAVYELFPLLAPRKRLSGAQLSGGEQQILAIARALLTNPKLLVMDEPSEGLARTIVEELVETIRKLADEGVSILLIEQNLGVATAVADRLLVMARGAERVVLSLHEDGRLQGIAALGGSGGTSIAARAMRALPVGVPKLIVSTMASGDTRPYVARWTSR
jgi:ABC-type branched-subunit amino acid transport system ATPase component